MPPPLSAKSPKSPSPLRTGLSSAADLCSESPAEKMHKYTLQVLLDQHGLLALALLVCSLR